MIIEHVETNVTLACQNTCVGCNHYIPMQKGTMAKVGQIAKDLSDFGKIAHIHRWAAIGGEPLLNKKLVDILKVVRESGVVDLIEVWTNGMLLPRMSDEFWGLVDEVHVTLYPGKTVDQDYIERKGQETNTAIFFKNGAQDFTTLLYRRTASDAEAIEMYTGCWYKTYCRVLDNGYFYRCCTSPFVPKLILGLPEGTDGLKVEGATEDDLRNYLESDETPKSCYRCAGHSGTHIGWKETSREQWLNESMG